MGKKENNNNQNESPVARWLRNAVLGATMADQPAMMTASGWRQNEKGDYVQDQQNDPHVKQLRDNLAAEGMGVMLGEFGIPAIYGLYNLGIRGLGRAGNNWARAKLISREMQNAATPNHTYPLNVGWGPKQTIKVTHATDSQEPLQLFFDKRWDVTHEGANPFGVWYQGKWGQPRTAATNSLPGKAEKAAKARKIFEDRKYKHEGTLTLKKPMITVGEVSNRSALSYDVEKMGADGIIYNNVYDNGFDNNQVILSQKLHRPLIKRTQRKITLNRPKTGALVFRGGNSTPYGDFPYYYTTDPRYASHYGKVKMGILDVTDAVPSRQPFINDDPISVDYNFALSSEPYKVNNLILKGKDKVTWEFEPSRGIEYSTYDPKFTELNIKNI